MDEIERYFNKVDSAFRDQQSRIWKLEQELKNANRPSTIVNETNTYIDTKFLEEGLYAQLLFMVGRTKDAKKFAEEWIASYEINNKLREPTEDEQKQIDKDREEFYKKAKEIFPNAKYMPKDNPRTHTPEEKKELDELKKALEKAKNKPVM